MCFGDMFSRCGTISEYCVIKTGRIVSNLALCTVSSVEAQQKYAAWSSLEEHCFLHFESAAIFYVLFCL